MFQVASAQPVAENVVRVTFTEEPKYTCYLDPGDLFDVAKFTIDAIGGVGFDGEAARAVSAVDVLSVSGDLLSLDVTVDRSFTRHAAQDEVTVANTARNAVGNLIDTSNRTATFFGVKYAWVPATDETQLPKDFAMPGTLGAVPIDLSATIVDTTADYGVIAGLDSVRQRVYRLLITSPGGFAHAPGWGVGVSDLIKQLATNSARSRLKTNLEIQLRADPDISKAKVIYQDVQPGLVRIVVLVRTREGVEGKFTFDATPSVGTP